MPELDPDLVNLLTIGLLGLIVILLLLAISSIGRVRKAIERAAAQRERERGERWESAAPSAAAQTPTVEPEPAIERSPEPAATTRAADSSSQEQEPATQEPVAATAGGSGSGAIAAETAAAGSSRGEAYEGGTSEGIASSSTAEPAAASTSASTQTTNEPQEQPFERDGRWWFRRGSELLVYDEGTGQWMTAPEERGRHSPMETQPIPTTISNVATESSAGEGSVSEQHGFWKCPSCGAVNGSTATSCRMCFTARP